MALTGTYTPDNLIASEDVIHDSVTISAGQNLVRGAVLGKVTATGEYVLSLSGATDGSEVAHSVLSQDTDATAAAVTNVPVLVFAEVNANALTIGTGHTVQTVKDQLRAVGVYVKTAVAR